MRDALSDSEKIAIVSLYELLERGNIPILARLDKIQVIICLCSYCDLCPLCSHNRSMRLENSSSGEAMDASRDVKPFPAQCHLRVRVSLHHDLAGHLWVNRAVVGIRSRLGKRIGEVFIRIQHLGLEYTLRADRCMR